MQYYQMYRISPDMYCATDKADVLSVFCYLLFRVFKSILLQDAAEENTKEEMYYIIDAVREVVEYLRDMSPVWEALEKGEKEHVI